jgi:hypothetical protein
VVVGLVCEQQIDEVGDLAVSLAAICYLIAVVSLILDHLHEELGFLFEPIPLQPDVVVPN